MKKYLNLIKENQIVFAFIMLGLVSALVGLQESDPSPRSEVSHESVDTFIPKGFVLIPIELQNADSLSSIIGEMGGVVDLYTIRTETHKGGLKIGARLKLLKAPLNPQQYAVLVPEQQSHKVLAFAGPFMAVIQNPEEKGSEITSHQNRSPKVQIHYSN